MLGEDPYLVFETWYAEALASGERRPDAMTLATADAGGRPSARTVLYKGIERGGLRFFTSFESRKARDIRENPRAALVFYWASIERQVRVEGRVEALGDAASDAYFATRPRGSQLGAWASPQSEEIASRVELEARVLEIRERYEDGPIPRPPFWGGYLVVPDCFEFWIARNDRLHDRYLYRRRDGVWVSVRLAP